MDPNACYDLIMEAQRDGDWDAVAEHVENLQTWLARGGFEPDRPNWRACVANAWERSRTLASGATVARTNGMDLS